MKKLIVVVIALALLLPLSGCCMNIEEKLTSYTATFTMYIQNKFSPSDATSISSSDLATSQRITNTCMQIIQSNRILNIVAEELGNNLTANQIREMMSMEAMNETEILKISVTSDDSQLAMNVAQALAKIAPNELPDILEGLSIKIVDNPRVTAEISLQNLFR